MAKVFVGMSGGVDSSVAAALLVEQGHQVTGVYMKNWAEDLPGMHCPWAEDVADAKRVAVGLGIDFKVFDFQDQYKQKVVSYMIDEYQAGRTPNPDIMCNQEMKFKLFLEAALEQGADYIATGHYARVQHPDSRSNSLPASSAGPAHSVNDAAPETASARRELDTPVSLHTSSAGPAARSAPENFSVELKTFSGAAPPRVTHEEAQLSGGVVFETSAQTRESSPELSGRLEDCLSEASSAETPDSDGLVSRRAEAVSNSAPPDKTLLLRAKDEDKDQTYFLYRVGSEALSKVLFPLGDYTKQEVRQMAKDRGLWTADKKESMGICFVGQVGIREFLSQYVKTQPGDIIDSDTNQVVGQHDGAIFYTLGQRHGLDLGGGLPYYVVGKDMNKNEVYVSRKLNDQNLWKDKLTLEDVFWVNSAPRNGKYLFRTRHRAKLIEGELTIGQTTMVSLDSPERAVTPGQSVVIYDGEVVLGGGIVKTD